MSGFIYIASPYSHLSGIVRYNRFIAVCRVAARLMEEGHVVFSPIAHSHPICEVLRPQTNPLLFWMRQDLPILALAEKLVVLMLPGWDISKGVKMEMDFANEKGIPVEYMQP